MFDFTNVSIDALTIHKVGNKLRQEGMQITKRSYPLTKEIETHLLNFFIKPFSATEVFQFAHASNLKLNELWSYSKTIFEDSGQLLKTSVDVAKHLYQCSEHPKIKSGEIYFALLKNVKYGTETINAFGVFKSETKDLFIKVSDLSPDSININIEKGANIKSLDKGCIVLNICEEDGFRVLIFDNNHDKTRFWQDRFLAVTPTRDEHFFTKACLSICQKFSDETFDKKDHRKDQILFLKKSVEYFSGAETFDLNEFSNTVFNDKLLASRFKAYKSGYEEKEGLPALNSFTVSQPTIKKIKKGFKDLIRLDTKIEVKLKFKNSGASASNIERGFDSKRKMFFYKLFFNKEL
jgi:hypothetical protein